MNILCKLKLHRWNYKGYYPDASFPGLERITRYCERCEKIEKTITMFPSSSLFSLIWESVIPKKCKKEVIE